MTPRPRDPRDLLPLTPAAFHILLSLVEGERHGYAIMQEVERRSGGTVALHPGTLYRALGRLLDDRLIDELDERPAGDLDDERRRYYRLTPFGREVARAEAERMQATLQMARAKNLIPKPRI